MMNYLGLDRAIYDKVWNRKNYFKIPICRPIEGGILRAEKLKLMLHFSAADIVLLQFEFSPSISK